MEDIDTVINEDLINTSIYEDEINLVPKDIA